MNGLYIVFFLSLLFAEASGDKCFTDLINKEGYRCSGCTAGHAVTSDCDEDMFWDSTGEPMGLPACVLFTTMEVPNNMGYLHIEVGGHLSATDAQGKVKCAICMCNGFINPLSGECGTE